MLNVEKRAPSRTEHQERPLCYLRRLRPPRAAFLPLVAAAAVSSITWGAENAHAQEQAVSAEDAPSDTEKEEIVITEKARAHFRAGVNLLQDPDGARYEEAFQQFKAAYAESPSWKILSNLGIAAMKLERDGEAIDAFERYLAEGGEEISDAERDQTQRDLDTLKASVVTLKIATAPEGVKLIDQRVTHSGSSVINHHAVPEDGQVTLRVRPGIHKVTARLAGYEDSTWEINAAAASSHEHAFELQKPQPKDGAGGPSEMDDATHRPIPTSVWVGVGVTGALTVGAVVTGALALNKNGEYDDANLERDPEADDMRKGVKTMNLVTDVLIGSAVAAGIVTTVLYVTRPKVTRKAASLHIDPLVGPHLAALSLSGKF